MPPLREVQEMVCAALLRGDDASAGALVVEDGLDGAARWRIYRHHVFTTLTAVLRAAFPVVCRLVDERFFGYAAHEFIRLRPPSGPCLFEYGATFPEFLAAFPPCRHLPYLVDVARLEWAMARAFHAPDAAPLAPEALRALPPEAASELVFTLDPSLSLLASRWPIDAIWRANQPGSPQEGETVDLRAGAVTLEVRRRGDDVDTRPLDAATYAFRRALVDGHALGLATEAALVADPAFDLPTALSALVQEHVLVGFTFSLSRREND